MNRFTPARYLPAGVATGSFWHRVDPVAIFRRKRKGASDACESWSFEDDGFQASRSYGCKAGEQGSAPQGRAEEGRRSVEVEVADPIRRGASAQLLTTTPAGYRPAKAARTAWRGTLSDWVGPSRPWTARSAAGGNTAPRPLRPAARSFEAVP